MYRCDFKRIFDFAFSIIALILLSPIVIFVTSVLFIQNDGKPFFVQVRPGQHERLFIFIKFKKMNDKKD